MEDEIIRDPWQWNFSLLLIFSNGRYGKGSHASPFHNHCEAWEYRNSFLDVFEARCKILGIKIRYDVDEIEQVEGGGSTLKANLIPRLRQLLFYRDFCATGLRSPTPNFATKKRRINTGLLLKKLNPLGFVSRMTLCGIFYFSEQVKCYFQKL